MKINFYTEMGFEGKISKTHNNMRTEFAWMCALNATHYPISKLFQNHENADLAIIILPKTKLKNYLNYDLVELAHKFSKKVAFQQEGPVWGFQDLPLEQQILYYNTLLNSDFILCHNELDKLYFHGLTGKPVYVMKSLMITDNVKSNKELQTNSVIIGGNMCSWYGGFDSWIIAQEFELPIYAPSMGRKIDREDELDINYLPYMKWSNWMTALSTHKYAVHLMRTHAAGTFALNCSYWGIPCIGYKGLDTQEILHPLTTVELGDLDHAREVAKNLKKQKFYELCVETTQKRYANNYTEKTWLNNWREIENKS